MINRARASRLRRAHDSSIAPGFYQVYKYSSALDVSRRLYGRACTELLYIIWYITMYNTF